MSKEESIVEHSVNYPKDASRLIHYLSDQMGLTPQQVSDAVLNLSITILNAEQLGKQVILKTPDREYDLTHIFTDKTVLPTLEQELELDPLSITITPEEDLRYLEEHFASKGFVFQASNEAAQLQARSLTQQVQAMVLENFGDAMMEEQRARVKQLDQGVLVVDSLAGTIKDMAGRIGVPTTGLFGNRMVREAINRLIRSSVAPDGLTMDMATAIVFQKGLFSPKVPENKRLMSVAREVLHVAGDYELPILLSESLTDVLASRSLFGERPITPSQSGKNYRAAFKSWDLIEQVAGTNRILSAYFETPMVEREYRHVGETLTLVNSRFTEHPLHDFMRERFTAWDSFVEMASRNKMIIAYNILEGAVYGS